MFTNKTKSIIVYFLSIYCVYKITGCDEMSLVVISKVETCPLAIAGPASSFLKS